MKVTFEKLKNLDFRTNEAYKTLRTNISFCGDDVKVIAFSSAIPNEGKSTVSFETARAFALDDKKVLLIDADVRKSVLISRLGTDAQTVGLTHYLSGKIKLEECVYETNVEHMDMVFTGPSVPNPSELLGNHYFKELITWAREHYDYVIVDCPPLGSVIDAAIIATECDGFVWVIESDSVSYKTLQLIKKQMLNSGTRILGVVLNKVEVNSKKYGYGYGYGYYSSYYSDYYGEDK